MEDLIKFYESLGTNPQSHPLRLICFEILKRELNEAFADEDFKDFRFIQIREFDGFLGIIFLFEYHNKEDIYYFVV